MAKRKNNHTERNMRRRLVAERGWSCHWCGQETYEGKMPGQRFSPDECTIDHIIPRSLGGHAHPLHNAVIACAGCNQRRGNMRVEQWVRVLREAAE